MHARRFLAAAAALLPALGPGALAEDPLAVSLEPGRPVTVELPGPPAVVRWSFEGPAPARNLEVRVNGGPVRSLPDALRSLGLADTANPGPIDLFRAWNTRQAHGAAPVRTASDPVTNLAWLGYSLCGESAQAMGRLGTALGWSVRPVQLNGHAAMEHRAGDHWQYLDADRFVWCPRWDNPTPASADQIVRDPLLALRVRTGGPFARYHPRRSALNASLFERVTPTVLAEWAPEPAPPPRRLAEGWELWPGESVVASPGQPPPRTLGPGPGAPRAAHEQLCTVELQFAPGSKRPVRAGRLRIRAPLPAVLVRLADGRTVPVEDDGLGALEIPADPAPAAVVFQSTAHGFGAWQPGPNRIELTAAGPGARLRVELERFAGPPPPPPHVVVADPGPGAPFRIEPGADADLAHWLVSATPDGPPLAPNLESIAPPAAPVHWDVWADSFLAPEAPSYARARVRTRGVWSGWSAPARIDRTRPAIPANLRLVTDPDGRVRGVEWDGPPAGGEARVFASDRLDFIPDTLALPSIVRDAGGKPEPAAIEANLWARGSGNRVLGPEPRPARNFFRVLWTHPSGGWTLSPLLRAPAGQGRPEPQVLQTRHRREPDDSPLGYRDRYEATLMPVADALR